ncbi:unnamed protein product [Rotaria magnacalcarata]|uniref:Calponin-homology (CH) domain-containing protein n=1 Tax=Rotaria magnacalcarata TaxID=392030 RepID=A0A819MSL5_9BILA|nr:unnamed protein product [Rotaria magnacalcarata]CAF3985330.1 unnamed protein product [Rotaria magnacalcarata]
MFYENLIPYYAPYDEESFLRQVDTFNQQQQQQQTSFYYSNKRKEYASSSLLNSSILNNPATSASSSFFPTLQSNSLSKKIVHSTDALSFCHTIYITIKKHRNTPSRSSSSPLINYTHQSPEESQLLLLPDICCTIPATSNTPTSNTLLSPIVSEPGSSIIKSTNFTGSVPTTRSEIRHKSEIEIEVKHEKQRQTNNNNNNNNNASPSSTASYPSVIRPTTITNKRAPTILFDEQTGSQPYQQTKRRILTNSIQTQTPPLQINQHDHHVQQQQLKALTDESLSKNEKIQAILRELTDCQAIIKQQEQQLTNGKKDRDQLCFIVDERSNELRNLKQKNERLEQMIRNDEEHSNDEKKLLSLLQESQEERDELLSQQRQTHERIQKLEEQLKHYESEGAKMRDNVLCSKIKFEKKSDENERLINDFSEMKKSYERLEQENQRLKLQVEHERKKAEECTKSKTSSDIELQNIQEKLRTQRYEHETKIATLDETLKYSQKQHQTLQQNYRTIEDKYEKEIHSLKEHINELEIKIEEVIKDKALASIRCGELIEENRKLEKALIDKEDDYEEKIAEYREKNSLLSTQIEDVEKKLTDTKKQLEFVTVEKDETLSDMLIAVRVASEMRHDAEDRLSKATDDLKRVTEHIEQEKAINKEVQRRQMQLPPTSRSSNGFSDFGHIRIKEMIRTLEANSRNGSLSTQIELPIRQRPLSQPCTRTETNAILTNSHHRQFGTTTDDAKLLSSTRKHNSPPSSNCLNNSHRSDISLRSITNEQYDEMKSIVEAVFARMPGSVCKRDALLKWCGEKLANYGITITNFSNSWTDGIAFCSLLHSYLPDRIDLDIIKNESKKKRFEIAFSVASSVGIVTILDVEEMCSSEWPDWERVMYYVALIFRHFEGLIPNQPVSPSMPIPQATSSPLSSSNSSPTFSSSSSSSASSSSSSLCASLRTSNSIPTTLCSALQTV